MALAGHSSWGAVDTPVLQAAWDEHFKRCDTRGSMNFRVTRILQDREKLVPHRWVVVDVVADLLHVSMIVSFHLAFGVRVAWSRFPRLYTEGSAYPMEELRYELRSWIGVEGVGWPVAGYPGLDQCRCHRDRGVLA